MNYGEENEFELSVRVEIRPLWVQPATNTAQEVGRHASEVRMEALGYELARFIKAALDAQRTPEAWADVSHRLRQALSDGVR